MTSLQIEYFLKAAECMSFSRAAAELYVSQPAVSRQVKLLEEELGHPLFDRTRRNRLSLTSAGIVFRESFSEAVRGLEAARISARELAGRPPLQLRAGIGAGWDMSEVLLDFRRRVLRQYPQATLSFFSYPFRALREKLQTDELDVILCTKTSILDFAGLDTEPITNLESRAYVRRGLLAPEDRALRLEDFNGQTLFMLQEEESPLAMELVQIELQAHQIKVHPVWLPNRETILQAVLMGEGFTVFDQHMYFRTDPRLTYYSLGDVIPICAAWRSENQNPLIQMFADHIALHQRDR